MRNFQNCEITIYASAKCCSHIFHFRILCSASVIACSFLLHFAQYPAPLFYHGYITRKFYYFVADFGCIRFFFFVVVWLCIVAANIATDTHDMWSCRDCCCCIRHCSSFVLFDIRIIAYVYLQDIPIDVHTLLHTPTYRGIPFHAHTHTDSHTKARSIFIIIRNSTSCTALLHRRQTIFTPKYVAVIKLNQFCTFPILLIPSFVSSLSDFVLTTKRLNKRTFIHSHRIYIYRECCAVAPYSCFSNLMCLCVYLWYLVCMMMAKYRFQAALHIYNVFEIYLQDIMNWLIPF